MKRLLSLVLADDHALVRDMLAQRLEAEGDMRVVASVANAQEAVGKSAALRPDVVLMDIDMPGLSAFEAGRDLKRQCPGTRLVFLSAFFHDRYIEQALALEAAGFITKSEPPETIVRAIRTVMTGHVFFSQQVHERLVVDCMGVRISQNPETRVSLLTERELQVLVYIARGLSRKEMARLMDISVKTVEQHSAHVMEKLDIHDRVELARFAIREGLAEP